MTVDENLFLGRELRRPGFPGTWLRMLDRQKVIDVAGACIADLQVGIHSMTQAVESFPEVSAKAWRWRAPPRSRRTW